MEDRARRAQRAITLSLLFLAGVVNFFDRASLSVANTSVRAELHLSATQMGWLLTAISLAYGIAQLPLIGLLERFGTRVLLGAGLAVWSTAQMLTGLVRGIPSFLALRVALGAGESPFFPAGIGTIRRMFPVEHRGRATAAMNTAQALSLALAPPILTWWMVRVGWRWMFASLGGLGVLIAIAWMAGHRDAESEASELQQAAAKTPWSRLLEQRSTWGMMLGWGGVNYASWLYIAWLPGYLEGARHVSLARAGWLAAVPFLAGAIGMLVSGVVSDGLLRSGAQPATIHRRNLVVGLLLAGACTLAVSHAQTVAGAVACISAALFAVHFSGTSGWGLVQAVGGAEHAASLGALQNFAGFLIASVAPVLTGWIVDHTHAYTLAFVACAAVTALGAASYAFLATPKALTD